MKKFFQGTNLILIIGILIFLVGCIFPYRYEKAIEEGYEVEATVTDIVERAQTAAEAGPDDTSYTLYGDYTIDGKEYTHVKLGKNYSDSHYIGEKLKVVVNPDNPGKPMFEGGILCTVGFLIAIGAIIAKVSAKRKAKKQTQ